MLSGRQGVIGGGHMNTGPPMPHVLRMKTGSLKADCRLLGKACRPPPPPPPAGVHPTSNVATHLPMTVQRPPALGSLPALLASCTQSRACSAGCTRAGGHTPAGGATDLRHNVLEVRDTLRLDALALRRLLLCG